MKRTIKAAKAAFRVNLKSWVVLCICIVLAIIAAIVRP